MYCIRPQPWSDWPCSHLQAAGGETSGQQECEVFGLRTSRRHSRSLSMSKTGSYSRRTMGMTLRFSFIEKQTTSLSVRKALDHPKRFTAPRTINHDQGDQTFMAKDQEEVRAGQKDFRSKLKWFSQTNFGHGFNSKLEWAHETHALFRKGLQCFPLKT